MVRTAAILLGLLALTSALEAQEPEFCTGDFCGTLAAHQHFNTTNW